MRLRHNQAPGPVAGSGSRGGGSTVRSAATDREGGGRADGLSRAAVAERRGRAFRVREGASVNPNPPAEETAAEEEAAGDVVEG